MLLPVIVPIIGIFGAIFLSYFFSLIGERWDRVSGRRFHAAEPYPVDVALKSMADSTLVKWRGQYFRETLNLRSLPIGIQKILGVGQAGPHGIAERDSEFQVGCVVVDSQLPGQRFILAGLSDNSALVAVEHRGFAYSVQVSLIPLVAGNSKAVARWRLFENPKSLLGLLDLLDRFALEQRASAGDSCAASLPHIGIGAISNTASSVARAAIQSEPSLNLTLSHGEEFLRKSMAVHPGMRWAVANHIMGPLPHYYSIYLPDQFMGPGLDRIFDLDGKRGSILLDSESITDKGLVKRYRSVQVDATQVDASISIFDDGSAIGFVSPTFDGDTLLMIVRYKTFVKLTGGEAY